ncbi:unnamed protein product [Protopolystoma xenopodis]|uniref:Fibronectin type-III domain-containing protein n=1 Tax=Protopolystoma xenopodis TaxID=117903 RepID=A0A448WXU0_9PLAT|nr:unnamed protein product [Protopolystoma xenopodis]
MHNASVSSLLEPPSEPESPEARDVSTNSCLVTWRPPYKDGDATLAYYHLEKRANQKGNWVRATNQKLSILAGQENEPFSTMVTGLIPDNVYEFRVAAENVDGLTGEFSLPSHRISTQPPFSIPGKPSRPDIKNVTETSATLTWRPPYDDGGDSIKHYLIQYKVTSGTHWAPSNEEPIDCEFALTGLNAEQEYHFRVAAVNTAGPGEWSDVSETCTPYKVVGK